MSSIFFQAHKAFIHLWHTDICNIFIIFVHPLKVHEIELFSFQNVNKAIVKVIHMHQGLVQVLQCEETQSNEQI